MNPKKHLKVFVEDKTTGEIICNCGCAAVVEEKTLDRENINFEKNPDNRNLPSRPVSKIILHDNNLTTVIPSANYDYLGTKFKPDTLRLWHRVRRENRRARAGDDEERRLVGVLNEIANVSSKLSMPDSIKEDASYLARKIESKKESKGRNYVTVACICLYLASKRSKAPRNVSVFYPFLGFHKSNFLAKIMKWEDLAGIEIKSQTNSIGLLEEACRHFKLKIVPRHLAIKFLDMYQKSAESSGRSDRAKAAVSLYFAVKTYYGISRKNVHPCDLQDIADYFKLGYGTIVSNYTDVREFIFVNREYLQNTN